MVKYIEMDHEYYFNKNSGHLSKCQCTGSPNNFRAHEPPPPVKVRDGGQGEKQLI